MYIILLALHSAVRWLVLASLIFAILWAYKGWFWQATFSTFDNRLRHITATIAHIQLLIGLWLYMVSPIIAYFFDNFKLAIGIREIRFFGMEHSTMMLTAIIIITIGSAKAKRESTDQKKFKTMALWFTIGLLLLLISIPWPFSPLASRPYWRSL